MFELCDCILRFIDMDVSFLNDPIGNKKWFEDFVMEYIQKMDEYISSIRYDNKDFWKPFAELFCYKICKLGMFNDCTPKGTYQNFKKEIEFLGYRDLLRSTKKRMKRLWNDEKWVSIEFLDWLITFPWKESLKCQSKCTSHTMRIIRSVMDQNFQEWTSEESESRDHQLHRFTLVNLLAIGLFTASTTFGGFFCAKNGLRMELNWLCLSVRNTEKLSILWCIPKCCSKDLLRL